MSETKTVEVEATEVEVKEEQPVEATPETPVEEKPTNVEVHKEPATLKDVGHATWNLVKTIASTKAAKVVGGIALGTLTVVGTAFAISKITEHNEIKNEAMKRLETGEDDNIGTLPDGAEVDIPTTVSTENYVETTAE